jgi:hypothetical protein
MPAPSTLRERTLAAIASHPSPTRGQAKTAGQVIAAASVAVAMTVFEAIGGFAHGLGRPVSVTIVLATGWSLVAAALTWLVLARRGSTLHRGPVVVGAAALVAPILLFAWMHAFSGTYVEPYQATGYRCLRDTLFVSALPLAGFLVLRRAIEPRCPALLGAGAGAACASWGGALVDLWCPLTNTWHVLVGHVAPLILATIAGAIAGHFTLGIRGFRIGER